MVKDCGETGGVDDFPGSPKFLAGLLFQNTKVDQRHGQRFVIKDDILVTVELDLWFL